MIARFVRYALALTLGQDQDRQIGLYQAITSIHRVLAHMPN